MIETVVEIDVDAFLAEVSEEMQDSYHELSMAQLKLYEDKGPSQALPRIANISFRHRRMAQLVALGYSQTKVAAMLECTIGTVNRLCGDPTFQLLIKAELEKLQTRDHALQVKMQEVAEVGLDKLHDMLVDDEVKVKPSIVKDITTDMLDRSGFGPSRKLDVSKSFGIDHQTLENIKQNARPARRLLPAIEQASASEETDLPSPVCDAGGMPIPESEVSERETGPGTCLPTEILPISGEEL
jgi:hypothetical protein